MRNTTKIPENILTQFVDAARETIDKNLLGVYLHGSAAMECFNPKSSDLDLLVGVKEAIDDSTKRRFMDRVVELHEEFVKLSGSSHAGIEMSVLLQKDCKPFVYPTPSKRMDLCFQNKKAGNGLWKIFLPSSIE